jgi:hypothetical protein
VDGAIHSLCSFVNLVAFAAAILWYDGVTANCHSANSGEKP